MIFKKIYQVVRQIPSGRIMTYGQVAKLVGTTPRVVGFALHANKDRNTPCHRVIFKDGSLAKNYAFGGEEEQRKKLLFEGVDLNHLAN